ncbi:MAG: MBOAT family O-acyltransferase [bacterium]
MLFSSLVFLYIFLPFVVLLHFLLPKKLRNAWLLISSLIFYFWGEQKYIYVIFVSIIINYFCGLAIEHYGRAKLNPKEAKDKPETSWTGASKALLVGVVLNLGLLFYFKYFNFALENINNLFSLLKLNFTFTNNKIHLPIGISFFTFQGIAYLADVYRRDITSEKSFLNFSLYKLLFPQLIAGPIILMSQIKQEIHNRTIKFESFVEGLKRFIQGLSKKVLIANNVAIFVDQTFALPAQDLALSTAWLAIIGYALQIFFDFSGYSDMAVGIGKMLGFDFVKNFNYPYISKNLTEFWRRWNMSLSSWFRDYVYIPLGGSRVSKSRILINLMAVFLLTGFWHGASWSFIVWGLFNGFWVVLERLYLKAFFEKIPGFFSHLYAIPLILISWVFFRSDTIGYALTFIKQMFNFSNLYDPYQLINFMTVENILFFILGLIFSLPLKSYIIKLSQPVMGYLGKSRSNLTTLIKISIHLTSRLTLVGLFLLSTLYLIVNTYNPFIYFRF